jgi:serine-type D-Ala-D-Ala carboxypeptidase/endopeptidase (penicillin-binding protein 4)
MRRALLVLITALACAPSAHAVSTPTLQRQLTREMHAAGTFSGAYVVDLDSGRTLFSVKPDVPRTPASVEKLYTTATALTLFGADATLPTTVAGQGELDQLGVWRGDLYLRGGGDPTLDGEGILALARAVKAAGIIRVDGSVLGDESRFDGLRGSYRTGGAYDPDMGGVLSAVALRRGFSKDGRPAARAAGQLAKALRAEGVRVDRRSGSGTTPDDAQVLATVQSPPMRELVRLTNVPSDNFIAEMLVKAVGSRFGDAGTTAAGTGVMRRQLATFGVRPAIFDGSGLARADRTTPRDVVRLLATLHGHELGEAFEASLAVAGRTGTIRKRMRGTAAQDRCRAKTGTLVGVSALAGLCTATGGHTLAFAYLMNGMSIARAHRVQDHMTVAIARYDGVTAAARRSRR